MRIQLDKIASSTANVPLTRDARLTSEMIAEEGYVIAGRVRGHNSTYNQLEDVHGRMIVLHEGDVIAGSPGLSFIGWANCTMCAPAESRRSGRPAAQTVEDEIGQHAGHLV